MLSSSSVDTQCCPSGWSPEPPPAVHRTGAANRPRGSAREAPSLPPHPPLPPRASGSNDLPQVSAPVRCAGRRPVSLTLLHGVDRVKRQSGQARSSRAPSSAAGAGHIVKERDEGLKQRDSKSRGEYSSPPSHPRWMRRNQQFSAGCRRYQPLT